MTATRPLSKEAVCLNVTSVTLHRGTELVTFIVTHHSAGSGGLIRSPELKHILSTHTHTCPNVTDQDEAILLKGHNTLHWTSQEELIFLFFTQIQTDPPNHTWTPMHTHTQKHLGLQMNKIQKDRRGIKSMHHFTGKRSDTNKMQLYWENFSLKIWCRIWAVTSRKTERGAANRSHIRT